ncbi:MAG: hypothetical protein U0525_04055 [Patescibacteria group bacterium]
MSKINISKNIVILSYLVGFLVSVTSLFGIFVSATYTKETTNWAVQAKGQDVANLVVVLVLVISTFYLSNKSFKGYLVWLGSYLYLIYAYVIYAFCVHFNHLFLMYVAVLGLSIYLPLLSLININLEQVQATFSKSKNLKPGSILLFVIGIMFILLWLSEIIPSMLSGNTPDSFLITGLWTNPVHVLDLGIYLPAMIMTAVSVWRKKDVGYFMLVPLLVFSATMGLGIISLFAILSFSNGESFPVPGYIIGLLVILSSYFSYRIVRKI